METNEANKGCVRIGMKGGNKVKMRHQRGKKEKDETGMLEMIESVMEREIMRK